MRRRKTQKVHERKGRRYERIVENVGHGEENKEEKA